MTDYWHAAGVCPSCGRTVTVSYYLSGADHMFAQCTECMHHEVGPLRDFEKRWGVEE